MRAFGKCGGGGRRSAARAAVPVAAILTTLSRARCAAVLDLSCTGARLRGSDLPAANEDLEVKIEAVRAFATVVWSKDDQCGIAFESPLMPFEVERLRGTGTAANLRGLSLEEREALEDWLLGVAR